MFACLVWVRADAPRTPPWWAFALHTAVPPTVTNLVEILCPRCFVPPPLHPVQLTKSWAQGSTVLIGDACHPMMPNLGQGGCQAMEDGYMLTNMLKDVGDLR